MKNLFFILSFLSLFIVISSCSDDDIAQFEPNPVGDVGVTEDEDSEDSGETEETNTIISDSEIFLDDFTTRVEGNSKLTRNENNIDIVFEASNIPNIDISGHAIILWAAIYRSIDDFNSESVNPYSLYLVDSYVVNDLGNIRFNGRIERSSTTNLKDGDPIINPQNDVVLLYVKSNGKAQSEPKLLWQQLNTLLYGGCQDDTEGAGSAAACFEFLFSLHVTG